MRLLVALLLSAAVAFPQTLSLQGEARSAFARFDQGLLGLFKNAAGDSLDLAEQADGSVTGTLVFAGSANAVAAKVENDALVGLAGDYPKFHAELQDAVLRVDLGDRVLLLHHVCSVDPAIADLGEPQVDPDRRWTIAVYMAADNDLEPYAMLDLQELIAALPIANVEVVVLLDRAPGYYDEEGGWTDADIFRFSTSDKSFVPFKSLGEPNTADAQTLASFLVGAYRTFPAQHHAAFVWNHGGGWVGVGMDETNSWSKAAPDLLDLQELRTALLTAKFEVLGRPLEILAFDACEMAQLEVALQLADCAEYLLASEDSVPGFGYPYDLVLPLFGDANLGPRELVMAVPDRFHESYQKNPHPSNTLAAIDLRTIEPVANALDRFAQACQQNLDAGWTTIVRSLFFGESYEARSRRLDPFQRPSFDILDLTQRIALGSQNAAITKAYSALEESIHRAVLNTRTGDMRRLSHGLAVYAPRNESQWLEDYETTPLGTKNGWPGMIRDAIARTASIEADPIEFADFNLQTHQRESVQPLEGDQLTFSLTGKAIIQLVQIDAVQNDAADGWVLLRKQWVPDPNWMVRASAGATDLADLFMPIFQDGRTDLSIELTGLQFVISDGTETAARATLDSTGLPNDSPIVANAIWYPGNQEDKGEPVEVQFHRAYWNAIAILSTSVQGLVTARQVSPSPGDGFGFLLETEGNDGSIGTIEGPRLIWQAGLELLPTTDEPDTYRTVLVAQTLDGRASGAGVTYTVEANPALEVWAKSWENFDPAQLQGVWDRYLLEGDHTWRNLDSPSRIQDSSPEAPTVFQVESSFGPKDARESVSQIWIFEPRGLPTLRIIQPIDGGSDLRFYGPAAFGKDKEGPYLDLKVLQVGGVIWRWKRNQLETLEAK